MIETQDRRALLTGAMLAGGAFAALSSQAAAAGAKGTPLFAPYRPTLLPVTDGRRVPVRHIYCNGTENYPGYLNQKHPRSDDGTGRQKAYFFQKPDDSLVVAGETVPYPIATADLQATVELVVVIGMAGQAVSVDDAAAMIFGYAAGVVLVRADHVHEPEASIAFAADRSTLCSPVVPALPDLHMKASRATLAIDGKPAQDVSLDTLAWRPLELISRLSSMFALAPGDLIYCGSMAPPVTVKRGQRIDYAIERIGDFHNRIA